MLSNFCRVESDLINPKSILTEWEDPLNAINYCLDNFSRLNTNKYRIKNWREVGCFNVEVYQNNNIYRYYIETI